MAITPEQRRQMASFVAARIEEDPAYRILESKPEYIVFKKVAFIGEGTTCYLLLHHFQRRMRDYHQEVSRNLGEGRVIMNLFYKDNDTFFVRLADRAYKKREKSLKLYTAEERNRMIELRDLEKDVIESLELLGPDLKPTLTYYQPGANRLEESVRSFHAGLVQLDYSHLKPDTPEYRHAKEGISRDWRILEEDPSTPKIQVPAVFGCEFIEVPLFIKPRAALIPQLSQESFLPPPDHTESEQLVEKKSRRRHLH